MRRNAAAHVVALKVGGEHQALGQGDVTRDVLHGVHGHVYLPDGEGLVDLLHEQALAAEFGQIPLVTVTGSDILD